MARVPCDGAPQTGLLNRFTAVSTVNRFTLSKRWRRLSAKTVGIRAVAALAGVSAATVSLILNGKGSFPATTQARVLEAVQRARVPASRRPPGAWRAFGRG